MTYNIEKPFAGRHPLVSDQDASSMPMAAPKAYIIAHIEITDAQRYGLYGDVEEDAFARYGGRYLIRGGQQHSLVGRLHSRTIVIEFADMQSAQGFYQSLENQAAKSLRLAFAKADAILVEGVLAE